MNCIAKLVFASLVGAGLFSGMNVQAAQKPAAASKPGKAAIASSHQLATDAGLEILAKGGNAFDAAIAVGAALAVVEPESSGLGGGGFFLLHRVKDGKDIFIDAREAAPAASRSELWADADGKLDSDKATNGPLSAGIPGEPAAYVWLAEHYGKLPLKASLAPAIRIAREGFVAVDVNRVEVAHQHQRGGVVLAKVTRQRQRLDQLRRGAAAVRHGHADVQR